MGKYFYEDMCTFHSSGEKYEIHYAVEGGEEIEIQAIWNGLSDVLENVRQGELPFDLDEIETHIREWEEEKGQKQIPSYGDGFEGW